MKHFVKAILFGAIAVCLLVPDSAAAKKKIGIQLYSVMDAMGKDPQQSLSRLSDMGYNALELVQWGGDTKVFGKEPAEFKSMTKKLDQQTVSTHSSIQEDPAKEDEIMARWNELFKVQKSLGGKYFIIPSYRVDYTVADVQRMCEYFNRVGEIAAKYGLKLGYHNHAAEFQKLKDSDKVMWEYLVEHTDPNLVCFELDVYWCTKGGKSPVDYLKKYPKSIPLLHIKDDFVIGESGNIDFESIFQQFRKNGWTDYMVEIETPKWLREKTNADGSKYTQEQINEELFQAAAKSAEYLTNAKFVK